MREQGPTLGRWEVRILEAVQSQSMQEKVIARRVRLDNLIVADLITDMMFKGYVERSRRRWMFFFSREYFTITAEGLEALEAAKGDLDRILEIIKSRGQAVANGILEELPPLASGTIKATWRVAKFILK